MNILRLVYEWPKPWDGLTPGPYELTKAQLRLGENVTVFCGGGFKNLGRDKTYENDTSQGRALREPAPEGKDATFPEGRNLGTLKVFRFPRALRKLSLFLTTAPTVLFGYLFLKLTGHGPDIVHGHGHITACFNVYKAFWGWVDKTPYVLHLHITAAGREAAAGKPSQGKTFAKENPANSSTFEVESQETSKVSLGRVGELASSGGSSSPLDFWTRFWEWPLHKFSDWLGVRAADKVICVSSRVREEAIRYYGADREKLAVVENGVNVELFSPRPGKTASEENSANFSTFKVESQEPLKVTLGRVKEMAEIKEEVSSVETSLLYVGALQTRKNVHLLIEALARLPNNFHLTIVGRGDRDYEELLRRQARELKLEDRIDFEGYIEYPKLSEVYRTADIFILPSSYEGLPKVVLEALSSGVPVLSSGFEVAETICGLEFLEGLDADCIAKSVRRIVESGVEVEVEEIHEKFSWAQKAREIAKVYEDL